jgi:hypothetical protein
MLPINGSDNMRSDASNWCRLGIASIQHSYKMPSVGSRADNRRRGACILGVKAGKINNPATNVGQWAGPD